MNHCVLWRPFRISYGKYLYKIKIITSFDTFDARTRLHIWNIFFMFEPKRFCRLYTSYRLSLTTLTLSIKHTNWILCKWFTTQQIYIDYFHFSSSVVFSSFLFYRFMLLFFCLQLWWISIRIKRNKSKCLLAPIDMCQDRHTYRIWNRLNVECIVGHRERGASKQRQSCDSGLKLMSGAINFLMVGSPITRNMDIVCLGSPEICTYFIICEYRHMYGPYRPRQK